MFPRDVANLICDYEPKLQLVDWVDEKKLDLSCLSSNPSAIHLLEKNIDGLIKIDWWELSSNPAAIRLLEENPNKINWWNLCANPAIFVKSKRREELLRVLLAL